MSAAPAEAARPRPASILSPIVDLLCVGGLSILVIVPLLLSGRSDLGFVSIGALAWAQALINYSHFMASYRIIYRDRSMILRHKWASIGVPLILLGLMAIALAAASTTGVLLRLFFAVASAYLAWHYTGQVWGMMASHAFLDGTGFDRGQRLIIRGSLRILLSWHVSGSSISGSPARPSLRSPRSPPGPRPPTKASPGRRRSHSSSAPSACSGWVFEPAGSRRSAPSCPGSRSSAGTPRSGAGDSRRTSRRS